MIQGKLIRCVALLALLVSSGCSTLPEAQDKQSGAAAAPAQAGALAEAAASVNAGLADEQSAFLLVPRADEAMRWRLAMIDNARHSIDAQYFIWKDDASGSLVLEHILAAADRGVRVRMLVDDMFLSTGGAFEGADQPLAAIDHHPNIELRLFNPGKYRSGVMGLAGNFGGTLKTYNRRMHNKLMIFDGHFAILGGRNIGDEYFGLYEHHNFLDLDVLVAGTVVADTAAAYDDYWNAELAYPAGSLVEVGDEEHQAMRRENREYVEEQSELLAAYHADKHDWPARLQSLPADMRPGQGVFLQDEPVQRGGKEYRLYSMLDDLVEIDGQELIISTPYLIPVGDFLQHISEDVGQGVQVRLLTNSLASNDATAAHSHYKKYRQDLLATGASLYEFNFQPGPALRDKADVPPRAANLIGLHTKASSLDGQICFIGSLNMDPRSVEVNTENGLAIESESLCSQLHQLLSLMTAPDNAWAVTVGADGKLQWTSSEGTVDRQPASGSGQRMADWFFRMLPLESQL